LSLSLCVSFSSSISLQKLRDLVARIRQYFAPLVFRLQLGDEIEDAGLLQRLAIVRVRRQVLKNADSVLRDADVLLAERLQDVRDAIDRGRLHHHEVILVVVRQTLERTASLLR